MHITCNMCYDPIMNESWCFLFCYIYLAVTPSFPIWNSHRIISYIIVSYYNISKFLTTLILSNWLKYTYYGIINNEVVHILKKSWKFSSVITKESLLNGTTHLLVKEKLHVILSWPISLTNIYL